MRASVRATPDVGEGTFEAIVSSYAETYEIGWGWTERIVAGCFADSIAEHPTIPICWNHQWSAGPIGHGAAQELDLGLIVRGELYLDLDPLVQRVWRSMVARAVEEWSIAFFPERIVNDEEEPYCDLIERGDLIEATACFRGANPGTETLDLRGAPVVTVDGDAKAEVVRLRKLFSVPEIPAATVTSTTGSLVINGVPATAGTTAVEVRVGGAAAPGGEAAESPPTRDRLVRARARLAKLRSDDTPGESPEEAGILDEILDELDAAEAADTEAAEAGAAEVADEVPAADPAAVALGSRFFATRAGRDAMRARASSASGSPSSPTNSTTPV
jgi:HK97 family phage prohead protease